MSYSAVASVIATLLYPRVTIHFTATSLIPHRPDNACTAAQQHTIEWKGHQHAAVTQLLLAELHHIPNTLEGGCKSHRSRDALRIKSSSCSHLVRTNDRKHVLSAQDCQPMQDGLQHTADMTMDALTSVTNGHIQKRPADHAGECDGKMERFKDSRIDQAFSQAAAPGSSGLHA